MENMGSGAWSKSTFIEFSELVVYYLNFRYF